MDSTNGLDGLDINRQPMKPEELDVYLQEIDVAMRDITPEEREHLKKLREKPAIIAEVDAPCDTRTSKRSSESSPIGQATLRSKLRAAKQKRQLNEL
jgi:hypothetical protein